ncbi:hypothetical protein Tsubulata_048288 [Turnera subulata]|uniref:Zinc finger RING-H2-type domain-containing protein n=1 Tax=Turnera subulata TaxID=218843 RepID=A0A9Q0FJ83_9ROSI|nr:hypothetical protein Tsubulata_048288 [Turnera subulata]
MATQESDVPLVPAGEASSSSQKTKPLELKKWSPVTLSYFAREIGDCGICKCPLSGLCIECQLEMATAPKEKCPVELGIECQHEMATAPKEKYPVELGAGCQQEMATAPGEKCPVVLGVCDHPFHDHCMAIWLKKRDVCPWDNVQWKVLEIFK